MREKVAGEFCLWTFFGFSYPSVLTESKPLGKGSLEVSTQHHVVDFIVLSASHFK